MDWLNYHHLFYFWVVAREGSIAGATRKLRLAEPTISGQIRRLEQVLGEELFDRSGRRLVLTEFGRVALGYAEEIFSLGHEFLETVKGHAGTRPNRLRVGVADVLPKAIVVSLLRPVLDANRTIHLVCREDKSVDEFLEQLVVHAVDLVLADAPASPGRAKVINHHLGESGSTIFGAAALAKSRRKGFPQSLRGAPFLVAGRKSGRRQAVERWFDGHPIRANIVAEVDDSTLLMELAATGLGLCVGPTLLENEICTRYSMQVVGRLPRLKQQFYAISGAWRIEHPAVASICQAARDGLLARGAARSRGRSRRSK